MLLLCARVASAWWNIIHDADETYNYWEPLHFMIHGEGFQTWEYSPEYAIRSWTYILVHSWVGILPRRFQFYALRGIFAVMSASVDTFFVNSLPEYASLTYVGLLGTGSFVSSTAFLPSTFTQYTSTLGIALALRKRYLASTVCFAVGAMLGWPFSGLLWLPVFMMMREPFITYVRASIISAQVLLVSTVIDAWYYRIWTIVPLNIVLYNVFSDHGPDLFGTEPWIYYFKNLALNYNLLFPLALLAFPLSLVIRKERLLMMGFFMWFTVFTMQPHKEERFMYPVYPMLCLSAAYTVTNIMKPFNEVFRKTVKVYIYLLATACSIFRIWSLTTSYSAPLTFFPALPPGQYCMGSDWYRFSTSFLLPPNVTISFMESEFRGLLPGKFNQSWDMPRMNDRNEFDPSKVIQEEECQCVIYWSTEPGLGATPFVDRETGVKKSGYYSYSCE